MNPVVWCVISLLVFFVALFCIYVFLDLKDYTRPIASAFFTALVWLFAVIAVVSIIVLLWALTKALGG